MSAANATSPDETAKRARVERMKWLALGLLMTMLALLALSAIYRDVHPWLAWVFAFAEAAAVGAIADWFAVSALFRHPLGLPIPHTAIIPRNKDRIGDSLGRFVEHNFLTPGNVISKLRQRALARALADWLTHANNAREVAMRICSLLPALLDTLDDADVRRFLDRVVLSQFERMDLAGIAGHVLEFLRTGDHHQALLDHGLKALDRWLDANRALVKAKFGEASRYTPRLLDKYIVNRFVDGILNLLHEVAEDPQHDVRQRFDLAARDFIAALRTSETYRARGREIARELAAQLRQHPYYAQLWEELKVRVVDDIGAPDSRLVEHVAGALLTFAAGLREDAAMQQKVNAWVLQFIEGVMLRHRHQVSLLISDVVRTWDADEVSRKIELEIGKDLQYIRLNGTLVGGIVGVLLHAATRLAA